MASIIGLMIPVFFYVVWAILEHFPDTYLSMGYGIQAVQLLLWPSSIFMMATAHYEWYEPPALKIFALSAAVNMVLYMVIAALLWLIRRRLQKK